MALQYGDRVQETTATTGTGAYTLGGAATGYRAFSSILSNGDTCYYGVTDGTNWETGLGTYSSVSNTLTRTTIYASSNANSSVSWAAGTKNIWNDVPAAFFQLNSRLREVSTAGTINQLATDATIIVENNVSTPVTLALLAAASMPPNSSIEIVDGLGHAPANNITVVPNGADTINGQASFVMQYAFQWLTLKPIAAGWIMSG